MNLMTNIIDPALCPESLTSSKQYLRWKYQKMLLDWKEELKGCKHKIAAWQNDNYLEGHNHYEQQRRENDSIRNQ